MADPFSNFAQVRPVSTAPAQSASQPAAAARIETAINKEDNGDSAEFSVNGTAAEQKKGPVKKVKGFISAVKKVFANIGEYTKGTVKGLFHGALAGSAVYTGGQIINAIRTRAAEGTEKVVKKIPNKVLAGIAAAGVLAANIWTASLNASEKRSSIEHRYEGHKQ